MSHQGLKDRAPKSRTVLEIRGQLAPMPLSSHIAGGVGAGGGRGELRPSYTPRDVDTNVGGR